jgi:hypothetical protein
MINNKHLCDGNNISVYLKPSSDKTMDPRWEKGREVGGEWLCFNERG